MVRSLASAVLTLLVGILRRKTVATLNVQQDLVRDITLSIALTFHSPLATYFLLYQHNHISPWGAGEVRNNRGFYVDFARHAGMLGKITRFAYSFLKGTDKSKLPLLLSS